MCWTGFNEVCHLKPVAMPASFARFQISEANPTGVVGKDGSLYVVLSGSAALLIQVTPGLLSPLAPLGSTGGGVWLPHMLDALGLVITFGDDVLQSVLVEHVMTATRLGQIIDILMETVRFRGPLPTLRSHQLRTWMETTAKFAVAHGRASPEDFRVALSGFLSVSSLSPMPEASPTLEEQEGSQVSRTPAGEGGTDLPAPFAVPKQILSLQYGMLCPDGKPVTLGAFEKAIGSRLTLADRAGRGNLEWIFELVLSYSLKGLVEASVIRRAFHSAIEIPSWMSDEACAGELARAFNVDQPSRLIQGFSMTVLEARQALVAKMARASPPQIGPHNVLYVIDHYPPLITVLGGKDYCTAPPEEAWTAIRSFCTHAKLRLDSLGEGDFNQLSEMLLFVAPMFTIGAEGSTPETVHERAAMALRLLCERTEATSVAPKGDESAELLLTGYAKRYQPALYELLGNEDFMRVCEEVKTMITALVEAAGEVSEGDAAPSTPHPHDIIGLIISTGYMPLLHALTGVKDEVPALPVVKMIADTLRAHGPTFIGQLGFEMVMPAAMQVEDPDRTYPKLESVWEAYRGGNLLFDVENDFIGLTKAYYAEAKAENVVRVPSSDLLASYTRNQEMSMRVWRGQDGLYSLLGFSGWDTVVRDGLEFYAESAMMPKAKRKSVMRALLTGVLSERSVIFKRDLKKGDPKARVLGALVVPASAAFADFKKERLKIAPAVKTASNMIALGLGHLLPDAHIVPEDLPTTVSAGGGKGGERARVPLGRPVEGGEEGEQSPTLAPSAADSKKLADAEKLSKFPVGSRKGDISMDEAAQTQTFKGPAQETYPIGKAFHESEGVTPKACAAVWQCKGENPWTRCQTPDAAGHKTTATGAHWVPPGWRKKCLPILLLSSLARGKGESISVARAAEGSRATEALSWLEARSDPTAAACDNRGAASQLLSTLRDEAAESCWAGLWLEDTVLGDVTEMGAEMQPPPLPMAPSPSSPPLAAVQQGGEVTLTDYSGGVLMPSLMPPVMAECAASAHGVGMLMPTAPSLLLQCPASPPASRPPIMPLLPPPSPPPPPPPTLQHQQQEQQQQQSHVQQHQAAVSWASAAPVLLPSSNSTPRSLGRCPTVLLDEVSECHMLMPMVLAGNETFFGIPGGPELRVLGMMRERASREADFLAAEGWTSSLFPERADAHPFYLFELASPSMVVSGVLLSSPPPEGWEQQLVRTSEERCTFAPDVLCWAAASALADSNVTYRVSGIAAMRADTFRMPTAGLPDGVITGAMAEHHLNPRQVYVAAQAHRVPWCTVLERAGGVMADLRVGLRAAADAAVAARDHAMSEDLFGWLAVAHQPLDLSELDPSLHDECYAPDDARLARLPIPHIPCVATAPLAPLPGPPPYHLVPKFATGWEHVLRPKAYRGALRCQLETRSFYRHVYLHETLEGAVLPRFFACGTDSCYPWATALVEAGHVLTKCDGKITLRDLSRPPDFTIDPEGSAELLAGSCDAALRDACTTHGIVFYDRLAKQLVMMPPMRSIADGLRSVLDTLAKMIKLTWFESYLTTGLDDGCLEIGGFPGRHQSGGCVPRNYSNVMRMIVNNTFPHGPMYTTVGKRALVESLNASIGAGGDRAIRRAEQRARDEARGTTRREQHPAVASVQSIARRAEYEVPELLPGSGGEAAILPPEFKPFFFELMLMIIHVWVPGRALNLEPVGLSDDLAKFFHQFALSHLQRWACHMMILDPLADSYAELDALLSSAGPAELAIISELCMSMGTTPSSSWGQRYMTEFMRDYVESFHAAHLELYAEWEANTPAFASWLVARREIELVTGRCETYLLVGICYTDDPVVLTLCSCSTVMRPLVVRPDSTLSPVLQGTRLVVDAVCKWGSDCRRRRVIRGDPSKRHLGVQLPWVGANVFTTALIGYLGKAKLLRASEGLIEYLGGQMRESGFRKLAGLLHHYVFTVALPGHVMYNLYDGVDQLKVMAPHSADTKPIFLFLCGGHEDGSPEDITLVGAVLAVEVVNYDLANGTQYDLRVEAVQTLVLARIRGRVYSLVWGAPLCRTYSIRFSPRLRTPWQPRGVSRMPHQYRALIASDTALALFVVAALGAADDAGVLWGLEHPTPRGDPKSHAHWPKYAKQGTLFDDEDTRALAGRPSAAYFDFAQCFVGSLFQKYSRILGHRLLLQPLKPRLHGGKKCRCARHARVASGVDADGHFNSSDTARYPLEMKQAIIISGLEALPLLARENSTEAELSMPDRVVPVTARSRRAAMTWLEALGSRSGTSMLGVVFHSRPPRSVVRHRLHSDAAVIGTGSPGIAMNLYEHRYLLSLNGTGYLTLPIVALEFAGEGPLNLICFGHMLQSASVIVIPGDSLVVPTVLASRARGSRLLAFMHDRFLKLPVVVALYSKLVAAHEYGVGNPITDADSRGKHQVAEEIMAHMRLRAQPIKAVPPEGISYMDEVLAFFRTLPASERALEMLHISRKQYARRKAAEAESAKLQTAMLHHTPDTGVGDPAAPGGTALRYRLTSVPSTARAQPQPRAAQRLTGQPNPMLTRAPGGRHAAARPMSTAALLLTAAALPTTPLAVRPMAAMVGAALLVPTPRRMTATGGARAVAVLAQSRLTAPVAARLSGVGGPWRAGRGEVRIRPERARSAPPRARRGPSALPAGPSASHSRALPWEVDLLNDDTGLALLPDNPELLAELMEDMRDSLESCYAASTNKTDTYHMRAWAQGCAELGTPHWRTDMAANSGMDPIGYRRELILPALVFLKMYAKMSPRSKKDPAANPRSALQKLYGVAREHKKRGYKMAPFTLVMQVMAGQLRKYVERHGTDSLAPARKNPLTGVMIMLMLSTPSGSTRGTLTVDWASYMWVSVHATFAVLAETGMRKGDVSRATAKTPFTRGRLTFGKLVWLIAGVKTAAPTVDQLRGLKPGDGCWLTFGVLKNDAFGEHFGSKPSWLPYSADAPRNACRSLAALELAAAATGLQAARRPDTPLFGPALGEEWYHSLLDRIFVLLLVCGAGLSPAACEAYSVHSFRIYLACALYAANCPPERIMAILRWKSEEALLIYARMNDSERTGWILRSMDQVVDSTVAAHLPRIDPDEWVAALQDSLSTGALGRAAQDADAAVVEGDEEF